MIRLRITGKYILIEPEDPDSGIIVELKYSQTFAGLEKAMMQNREKRYDERLRDEGRNQILAYGIAFYKKRCKVVGETLKNEENKKI